MSQIYNINFGLAAERLSPPSKRKTFYLAWMKVLLYPLQWLHIRIFNDYAESSTAPVFNSGTTYNFGDFVRFEKAVYQNINLSGTVGITPKDTASWYKVQDNYIGVRERMSYNSQTVVLAAILNKAFDTSGFIIDNTDNDIDNAFFYNQTEGYPAIYYFTDGEDTGLRQNVVFLYNQAEYYPPYDFIVNAPAALNTSPIVKQLISAEVEKYKIAGTNFNVIFV